MRQVPKKDLGTLLVLLHAPVAGLELTQQFLRKLFLSAYQMLSCPALVLCLYTCLAYLP